MKNENIPADIKSKSIKEAREEINTILKKLENKTTNLKDSIDDYKRLSEALEAEAKDVPAALSGAVSIALKSWSQKAWDDLIESTQNGGG